MMLKRIFSVLLGLSISLGSVAQTIATINGEKIDSSDIERVAKLVVGDPGGAGIRGEEVLQFLMVNTLLAQEAKRLNMDKDAKYLAGLEKFLKYFKDTGMDKASSFKQDWANYYERLALSEFYVSKIKEKNPVTDQEVRDAYQAVQKNHAEFMSKEKEVQLGEIYTDKPEATKAVLKELAAKKKFSDVAKKYSINNNVKQTGGLVESYVPLVYLKEINEKVYQAVVNLSKGQYTTQPLVEGNISLVLYVNDKRAVKLPTFEQLKNGLRAQLEELRVQDAVAELEKKAKIQVNK